MSIRPFLLLCTLMLAMPCASVAAENDQLANTTIATWSLGQGTIAGSSVRPGTDLRLGQTATTGKQPAKIDFAAPLAGYLTLSPEASITVVVETVNDKPELVIDLTAGAVQVDLRNKGDYAAVRVRGAALDVRVTGTLFVVQRVKRDADYIALVQGTVKAGLRKEVADALGKGQQQFDLESRQGVGASTSGGMETIASLKNRPQIVSLLKSIKEQGTGPQEGDGGWNIDLVIEFLNELFGDMGLDEALIKELTDALGDALFEDLNQGPGDQVINTIFSSPGVLGAPPPPPPVN